MIDEEDIEEFSFPMLEDVRNIASGDIIGDNNGDKAGERTDTNIVLELIRDNLAIAAVL